MNRFLVLAFALTLPACSESTTSTRGSTNGPAGGGGSAPGSGGVGGQPPASIPVDVSCNDGPYDACAATMPLPDEVVTIIDLTDVDTVVGRCDARSENTWDADNHTVLPDDPAAYPLVVRVSAQGFAGPCTQCEINGQPPATTYGVAIALPQALWNMTAVLAVNEPWSIVAGGCGEACAIPCLEGYQEFAQTTCLGSYAREFGIATDVLNPPDAELLVDLAERIAVPCCPWQCSAR
jgi:hypothetical protein